MLKTLALCSLAACIALGSAALASELLPKPKGPVVLTVAGKIERTNAPGQAQFDKEMLKALGMRSFQATFVMSGKVHLFEGISLRSVLDHVGGKGTVIKASALDNYEVDIPMADLAYEPLIAMRADGKDLLLKDKGPLWIVYPRDDYKALQAQNFDSRWVWHLNRLQVE